jgi:hypothetical protein
MMPGSESLRSFHIERRFPVLDSIVLVAPGLLAGAVVMLRPSIIPDGDPYWHVALGEWILENKAIPHTDPFSYTATGPWNALEWLSQIAMGAMYQFAGMAGVQALFGISTAAVGIFLARFLLRIFAPGPAAMVQFFVLANVVEAAQARPQFLALPVIAFWMGELLMARQEHRAPHWAIVPVMVLWANMHGSFILGVVLIAFFAVEALLDKPKRADVLRWVALVGVTCLAALATPWGISGPVSAFNLTTMASNVYLSEWRSSNFDIFKTFEVCLLAALLVCLLRGARIPVLRLVLLLALLHQTLHHQRYTVVFMLLGAMLIAEPLANALRGHPPNKVATNWFTVAAGLVVFSAFTMVRVATPQVVSDTRLTPVTALARVSGEVMRQPVFNQFELGGFLILSGVRPFIDGRADVYGSDFVTNYFESVSDGDKLQSTLQRHGVMWAISATGHPLDKAFAVLPGWTLLYRDRYAAVYVRG